jgi:hypothetical protein
MKTGTDVSPSEGRGHRFDKTAGKPFWTVKRPEQSEGEGQRWPESILPGAPTFSNTYDSSVLHPKSS